MDGVSITKAFKHAKISILAPSSFWLLTHVKFHITGTSGTILLISGIKPIQITTKKWYEFQVDQR